MKVRLLGMILCLLGFSFSALAQIHHITYPGKTSGKQVLKQHLQQKPLSQQLLKNMAHVPLKMEPILQNYDNAGLQRKSVSGLPITYFVPAKGTILPKQLAQGELNTDARAQAIEYYEGLIDLYQGVAHKDGFPPNSVAYAFNYYVVNNYHVLYDLLSTKVRASSITPIGGSPKKGQMVTIQQEQTLFRQFEHLLSSDPSIKKMTDSEKQSITESLAIMTNECFKLYQYALENGNQEVLRSAQETALDNLIQLLGERAVRLRITNQGMEF